MKVEFSSQTTKWLVKNVALVFQNTRICTTHEDGDSRGSVEESIKL